MNFTAFLSDDWTANPLAKAKQILSRIVYCLLKKIDSISKTLLAESLLLRAFLYKKI
jgi:hypothetical protein